MPFLNDVVQFQFKLNLKQSWFTEHELVEHSGSIIYVTQEQNY